MSFFSTIYESSAMAAVILGKKRKFMNMGLDAAEPVHDMDLADAHHISLYLELIRLSDTPFTNALEIGCGRGGGCYVLKNYFSVKDLTGVDLSPSNIRLAQRSVPEGKFIVADAVTFRIERTFDLIVNLESSHRYSSRKEFFRNVSSMMHENSAFVFGDTILASRQKEIEEIMKESGFRILKMLPVNDEVTRSILKNSPEQYPLPTKFPFLFSKDLHNFFTTVHSNLYAKLRSGEILYALYLLKKG